MEDFFDRADVVFATPAPSVAAHRIPAKAPIPSSELVPRKESTYIEKVSETTPISAKTPTPQEEVIPAAVQTETASLILSLVISTSDPFVALSQAVKDGSSLVVTPCSIPSSATHGPDADLSFEESKDILEDPKDEPVLKKRIYDSDEEESAPFKIEFMSMCFFFFFFPFLPFYFLFYIYICIFAVVSLLFVCLFPCLQRPLRG